MLASQSVFFEPRAFYKTLVLFSCGNLVNFNLHPKDFAKYFILE